MLHKLSDMFELHVYTLGTRRYAAEILRFAPSLTLMLYINITQCRFIDPDGKLFSVRILTNDETIDYGSKSTVRLFNTMCIPTSPRVDPHSTEPRRAVSGWR